MKSILLVLALVLWAVSVSADTGLSTGLLTLNLSQALDNSTPSSLQLLSLKHPPSGVQAGEPLDLVGIASQRVSHVSCQGPSGCSCKLLDATEFVCAVSPPVEGSYRLTLSDGPLQGFYLIQLTPGQPVRVTAVQEAETAPSEMLNYFLALLALLAVGYALFFGYRALTMQQRSVMAASAQVNGLQEELRELKFRFLKRQIDDATYAGLAKQKEAALAVAKKKLSALEHELHGS